MEAGEIERKEGRRGREVKMRIKAGMKRREKEASKQGEKGR